MGLAPSPWTIFGPGQAHWQLGAGTGSFRLPGAQRLHMAGESALPSLRCEVGQSRPSPICGRASPGIPGTRTRRRSGVRIARAPAGRYRPPGGGTARTAAPAAEDTAPARADIGRRRSGRSECTAAARRTDGTAIPGTGSEAPQAGAPGDLRPRPGGVAPWRPRNLGGAPGTAASPTRRGPAWLIGRRGTLMECAHLPRIRAHG